ncbi:porin [Mesorhizobium sp. CO1-1-9]|uniref:porin n=1 Tax=Mesorhizobium sp. CO1-1-9 TaxID=2876630 RepID=UPI001CCD9E01|nr:porin [Mesorhizobium sp. CO1-1-9]MBZ9694931.1 porin [Mesorhizobium sp. CO1-1-9]
MNINSVLLGSAAALLAVSGARAADAVTVAEPEPAEYVKICDVYGAGYFYIPGTDTCLRVGGYIRYDVSGGEAGSFDGRNATDSLDGDSQRTWKARARLALMTWTGQETELGTLKTYTQTRFNFNDGTSAIDSHFMWIQLGGLRVGVDESAFDTFIGYAGNVINDTLVPYGGFGTNLISYTFDAGNGLSALISVEQGSGTTSLLKPDLGGLYHWNGGTLYSTAETIDSYMPNVVGGAKFTQGWGDIIGVAAYNSNFQEWAGKLRVDVKASDMVTLWVMGGYGTDDNIDRNFYKQWGGNWAIWGGGTIKLNPKISLNAQVSYDDDKNLGVAANVAYTVIPGFTVTAEVDYVNGGGVSNWTGIPAGKDDAIGGVVRFQRSF